jgi:hypothetical protein
MFERARRVKGRALTTEGRGSFLKKRTKKLFPLVFAAGEGSQNPKVFWFFFSKKNMLSSDLRKAGLAPCAHGNLDTTRALGKERTASV